MKIIEGITDQPKQQTTLTLLDGTKVVWYLEYRPQQIGWFWDLTWDSRPVANGQRLVASPNILRRYLNLIPFGIAVITVGDVDPLGVADLSDGTAQLILLQGDDLSLVETAAFGALPQPTQAVAIGQGGTPVIIPPSQWGPATGDLFGNYPGPFVGAAHVAGGQQVTWGDVPNGKFVKRVGNSFVGSDTGTGDVVGPGSAVTNRIATFNGTSGKLIEDSGFTVASVISTVLSANSVATLAVLKAADASGLVDKQIVAIEGYATAGDGGGGDFWWDAASTATPDDGTIIELDSLVTGRFRRVAAGTGGYPAQTTVDCRWFGMIPDFISDSAAGLIRAITALASAGGGTVLCPAGNYVFDSKVTVVSPAYIAIMGQGRTSTNFRLNWDGGMLDYQGAITISEIGFINIQPSTSTADDLLYLHGGNIRLTNLEFQAFYNDSLIHCQDGTIMVSDVFANNNDGCQLLIESCGGNVTSCFFSAGDTVGKTVKPCCIIRASVGGSATSLHLQGSTFRGQGPLSTYISGTWFPTVVLDGINGSLHEGSITDCFIDTTSGSGVQEKTIGILASGVSDGGVGDVSGWIIGDIYCNGCQHGLRLHGQDSGSFKNVSGFSGANFYMVGETVGSTTGAAIVVIESNDVTMANIHGGFGTTLMDVIEVFGGGSNATNNLTFTGVSSGRTDVGGTRNVFLVDGNVTNLMGIFNAANAGTPYTLSGGAAKANGIVFYWPDGTGGMNCSGALTQNV